MEIKKINVKSTDHHGEMSENIYSALVVRKERYRSYSYSDEYGKSNIIIDRDIITISRSGSIETTLNLVMGEATEMVYKTPYLVTAMELICEEMLVDSDGFYIRYKLFNDGAMINEIKIIVKEGM